MRLEIEDWLDLFAEALIHYKERLEVEQTNAH